MIKKAMATTLALTTLGAWARYKPANFNDLPELPTELVNGCVTLDRAEYKVTGGDHKIQEQLVSGQTPKGALRISAATVTLWMEGGSSVTALGLNSTGSTGGGAGIYLPSDKTLIFRCVDDGQATVTATGGNGYNATGGEKGANGHYDDYGSGGCGGTGGSAGGAGIGGYGGTGGSGSGGAIGTTSPKDADNGNAGGAGSDGGGTLWCYDGVKMVVTPGANGSTLSTCASGGSGGSGAGGGGGGGGNGGAAGLSPAFGGGGSGGGGGGGGGGGWMGGAGGGGGGGGGGLGGKGGKGCSIYSDGSDGANSSGASGGAGGEGQASTCNGSKGGTGGSVPNGGAGGKVWCYNADDLKGTRNLTVSGTGCGTASGVATGRIALEYRYPGEYVQGSPDVCVLAAITIDANSTNCLLNPSPVAVPKCAGWTFLGYFNKPEGGTQVIPADGIVPQLTAVNATVLYAQWKLAEVIAPAATAEQTGAHSAKVTVTSAPAEQVTVGFWLYTPQGQENWQLYSQDITQLTEGQVVTLQADSLPNQTPSGDFSFRYALISVNPSNGLSKTNYTEEAVTFSYIRRDAPVYDAATKTLWANGSKLKICRDKRHASRVVVFYDRQWDGVYEGVLSRATDLSGEGFWVNGGYPDNAEQSGGVEIRFESGTIYGLDAGTNIAESVKTAGNVKLFKGADAVVDGSRLLNWKTITPISE